MVIPNDGTGSPTAPLRLTSQAAATVRKRFEHASQDLTGHLNGMAGLSGAISEGAGELSGDIEADVLAFLQSWTSAFDVLSTSTALIAGNTNNLAVDLDALDRGSTIDLSGS